MGKHAKPKTTRTQQSFGRRYVKTPKGLAIIQLVVLALISIFSEPGIDTRALWNVVVAVLTGTLIDLIVGLFYKKKRFVSDGGIITGLIIAMVLGSFTSWDVTALTTVIAIASKHILKIKRKPVFNPAAFGLLVSSYVFSSMQSWWGGMSLFSNWYLIFVCLIGLWITMRVRKLPQVIAFLAGYGILSGVLMLFNQTNMGASFALQNPMLNSALFLGFFMLTDPPTSPAKPRDQIWFGALTGLLSVAIYMFFPAELTYLLMALLAANLVKFLHAQFVASKKKRTAPVTARKTNVESV